MRIEPTASPPVPPKAVGSAARTASANAPASVPGSSAEGEEFAPSGDLAGLLAAVRQAPAVRPDAVAAATAQLSAGALGTPEAATDTAKGLLGSGDLTPNS